MAKKPSLTYCISDKDTYLCGMLRIMIHIERMLLVHDCVIIPKLGGFVLQAIPATFRESEGAFCPMRKEIVFNTTLQHNDGLLSESYMQQHNVDFPTAQRMLEEDTEELNVALHEHHQISLGAVGSFHIGNEGQVIFQPNEAAPFSISSYGLSSFYFPTLKSLQEEEEKEMQTEVAARSRKDTYYLPVNRRLIRVMVASVAAIALFLLISTPVRDVNQSAYTASFIPTEKIMPMTVAADAEQSETNTEAMRMVDPLPATSSPALAAVESKAVKEIVETKRAQVAPEVTEKSMKTYHVIVASFPTDDQANEFLAEITRKDCEQAGRVKRDGKVRIYANKFDNREQAETYMATLRTNPKYKDAWLFISR
ncbi:MAG: SPOR domain-containing protein [Tannerellaceae bacterium]